jgi:two-component system, NarL family, response regulator DegU
MRSLSPGLATLSEPNEVARNRIRVLVADESTMGCELLRTAFKRYSSQFEVAGCEVSAAGVGRSMSQDHVDVALVSADLEDGRLMGLEALRRLIPLQPGSRVVILFDSWDDDLVTQAFRAGAKGVLSRAEPFDRLCKCIRSVYEGQVWANSRQLQLLLRALTSALSPRIVDARGLNLLTKRETQLVQLIAQAMPSKEISLNLGISEHTVSNYLFRIYNKIGVSNRLELALYAIKLKAEGVSSAPSEDERPGIPKGKTTREIRN